MANFASALAAQGRGLDNASKGGLVGHLGARDMIIPGNLIDLEPNILSAVVKAFAKHGSDWRPHMASLGKVNPKTGLKEFGWFDSIFGGGEDEPAGPDYGDRDIGGTPVGIPDIGEIGTTPTPSYQSPDPDWGVGKEINLPSFSEPDEDEDEGPDLSLPTPADMGIAPIQSNFTPGQQTVPAPTPAPVSWFPPFSAEKHFAAISKATGIPLDFDNYDPNQDWNEGDDEPFAPPVQAGVASAPLPPGAAPAGSPPTAVAPQPEPRSPFENVTSPTPASNVFTRPAAMEAPQFLGLSRAMTPIQQRAAIATYGVNADDASYRDPLAQEYYKNMVVRTLVGDDGVAGDINQLLPIEHQYLQQVLGLNYDMNAKSLLNALQGGGQKAASIPKGAIPMGNGGYMKPTGDGGYQFVMPGVMTPQVIQYLDENGNWTQDRTKAYLPKSTEVLNRIAA